MNPGMMENTTRLNRTVSEWRKNWLYMICLYFESNYEKVKETEVLSDDRIRVNNDEYKVDINDYTGSESNYIFFNPSNGRLVVQRQNRVVVERFDVEIV
jgi:hypothetical protein